MDKERTAILLAKYVSGELTPEQHEELEMALLADHSLREGLEALRNIQTAPPPGIEAGEEEAMLERGLARMRPVPGQLYKAGGVLAVGNLDTGRGVHKPVRRVSILRWIAAASVLVLAGVGTLRYLRSQRPKESLAMQTAAAPSREIATKYGTRSFLELPDGSKLWLNAGTKVQYAEGFANGKRELTLSGEAFFDVKHDPVHPFIVHIGKLDVTVLGTSFNVKAYPGDSNMETTLINGKVTVGLAGQAAGNIVLQPNEKVSIPVIQDNIAPANPTNRPLAVTVPFSRHQVFPDSVYRTIIETSWVDDKLVFRSEPFSRVAEKLERWYNIKFRFENDKYAALGLTGYFKDQPVGNVMHALSLSLGFRYAIEGDEIRIW